MLSIDVQNSGYFQLRENIFIYVEDRPIRSIFVTTHDTNNSYIGWTGGAGDSTREIEDTPM